MPDKRRHRGPNPRDPELFSDAQVPTLQTAVSELSWLLTRGYPIDAALKLVGDRYHLVARQRIAIRRAAASDDQVRDRRRSEVTLQKVTRLAIDGFNVIVTIEAAMAGGVLLRCRDGAIRDLASVHGSYRRVEETAGALETIARTLRQSGIDKVHWFLDSPVSNSGRLAEMIRNVAAATGADWEVELVPDVDHRLIRSPQPVATSDSVVLDQAGAWVNLAAIVLDDRLEGTVVDLSH